jgi:hypothetical protein
MKAYLSRKGMKTLWPLRLPLALIVLVLTASVGFSRSEVLVGTSGPLKAFRVKAPLGWTIQIRNDSDAKHTALYAINGSPALKVIPAHSTVKAGYVLGEEIPSFAFAPKK